MKPILPASATASFALFIILTTLPITSAYTPRGYDFIVGKGGAFPLACTNSMESTFDCNDRLYMKRTREFKVGDIVMYSYPRYCNGYEKNPYKLSYLIHKVWKVEGYSFYARGDNPTIFTSPDCKLSRNRVIGKMINGGIQ